MILLVEGVLLNAGFTAYYDGSLCNTYTPPDHTETYVCFFGVLINQVPFLLLELQKFNKSLACSLL